MPVPFPPTGKRTPSAITKEDIKQIPNKGTKSRRNRSPVEEKGVRIQILSGGGAKKMSSSLVKTREDFLFYYDNNTGRDLWPLCLADRGPPGAVFAFIYSL